MACGQQEFSSAIILYILHLPPRKSKVSSLVKNVSRLPVAVKNRKVRKQYRSPVPSKHTVLAVTIITCHRRLSGVLELSVPPKQNCQHLVEEARNAAKIKMWSAFYLTFSYFHRMSKTIGKEIRVAQVLQIG